MQRVREILAASGFYRGLEPASRERLVGVSRLVRTAKDHALFHSGEPIPGIYCVGRGVVRLSRLGPQGKMHVLRFFEESESFGEALAIGNFPAPVSAHAVEDCECALIPTAAFRELIERDHGFCLEILRSMAVQVHQVVAVLEDVVLRDAVGRLSRHLLAHRTDADGWLTLRVLKRDLAQHLNLTSETFSRTLRRLVDAKLLEVEGERLHVIDVPGLTRVADGGEL